MLEPYPLEPGTGRLARQRPSSAYRPENFVQTPAIVVAVERAFDMLRTMLMPARSAA